MPITTALLVAAAAYQAQKVSGGGNGEDCNPDDDDCNPPNITPEFLENKVQIELLPLEQSLSMLEWPIVTVSFYTCPAADMEGVFDRIEQRVQSILVANPWLGGWVVRGKGVGSFDKTPRLWYDPSGNETTPLIYQKLSHDEVPLDKDTNYIDYESILSNNTTAIIKTNPEIENRQEEPLFRVSIIPHTNNNNEPSFALLVSMSHICGDGHTYYRIYNMLTGNTPITSLKCQRELLYSTKVMELTGKQEAHYIQHITEDPAWVKLFRWDSSDSSADAGSVEEVAALDKLQGRVFTVDREWIANIKSSHLTVGQRFDAIVEGSDIAQSTLRSPMTPTYLTELENEIRNSNPTQSTNDILCSFFWSLVEPHVGLMSVNFRKRLDFLDEDHAGNYANPIPYTKEDYKSPLLIRKSLDNCRRAGVLMGGTDRPTVLPRPHAELTFSVITNWTSFLSKTDKEKEAVVGDTAEEESWCSSSSGINLIRHLPIISPKGMMKDMPKRMSLLIIFSSGVDDIGCALIAPGRVMNEIDHCGVVKELIARF
jgi:hypothetical protein